MSIHIDTSVYIMGDIHGNYQPIRDFYYQKMKYNQENDIEEKNITLILLGDFGGNFFFNYRDDKFKTKLRSYDMTYFVIRGNHEERPSVCMMNNPDEWHTEQYFGNTVYVENNYPYIKYALDHPAAYTIPVIAEPYWLRDDDEYGNIEWQSIINHYQVLVLPGAYSVDKYYRLQQGMTWFKNEQLTQQEMWNGTELASKARWDLILSHTCPIAWEPTDLFLNQINQSTVDKTMERWLSNIEYRSDYTLWCFGHFHQTRIYPKDWENNRQSLMLYNDVVLDLNSFSMDNYRNSDISSVWNSLIKIESY